MDNLRLDDDPGLRSTLRRYPRVVPLNSRERDLGLVNSNATLVRVARNTGVIGFLIGHLS